MKKWKNAPKKVKKERTRLKKVFDTENQRCSERLAGKSPG